MVTVPLVTVLGVAAASEPLPPPLQADTRAMVTRPSTPSRVVLGLVRVMVGSLRLRTGSRHHERSRRQGRLRSTVVGAGSTALGVGESVSGSASCRSFTLLNELRLYSPGTSDLSTNPV